MTRLKNKPTNPAIIAQSHARPIPSWALYLLCAIYLIPGLFDRDPWRHADLLHVGVMSAIAEGRTDWLTPLMGQVAVDLQYPTYWLGAAFISLLSPIGLDVAVAARIPFGLLLAACMALISSATFHLAQTPSARPLPLAFGGEPDTKSYAQSLANAAVLAFIACLGLLQLGHETTPEIIKLTGVCLLLWSMSACPTYPRRALIACTLALPLLVLSGSGWFTMLIGLICGLIGWKSNTRAVQRNAFYIVTITLLVSMASAHQGLLPLQVSAIHIAKILQWLRQLLWFLWPLWPLAAWTIWQWRHQFFRRHIALPASITLLAIFGSLFMGVADRTLLLSLPALAILAAFALPTMGRSTRSAIDWFSVLVFSISAFILWVIYASLHTGVPAQPAINIQRLIPGYSAPFQWWPLLLSVLVTAGWFALVRWRTAQHRSAIWKSLVLPASGISLNWFLLMTLCGHLLNQGQSLVPWIEKLQTTLSSAPTTPCIATQQLPMAFVAALEFHGKWRVDARQESANQSSCKILIAGVNISSGQRPLPIPKHWQLIATIQPPAERKGVTRIYQRFESGLVE